MARSLRDIATEIDSLWSKVYFGARPYLDAMYELTTTDDSFYNDSGDSIVRYFLSNASNWRGPDARRIKTELKAML